LKQVFILTPFPKMVDAIISESILGRSEKKKLVKFHVINLFDFSNSSHQRIDDYPFGGGAGMILKPEPMFRAYDKILSELPCDSELKVVYPTPDGQLLNHELAFNLSQSENLIFICGHYKGIDQRIRNNIVTDEVSIGDYVITGGELASIIILDASIRLIPGVLNSFESAQSDSFSQTLLDCPYYTRPEIYREMKTPEVLLSGNHGKIEDWKKNKRIQKTKDRRPDLWEKYNKLDE